MHWGFYPFLSDSVSRLSRPVLLAGAGRRSGALVPSDRGSAPGSAVFLLGDFRNMS